MSDIRLDLFSVGDYRPGGNAISRILWHFCGSRIVRSQTLISYRLKATVLRLFGAQIGKGVVIKPGVRVKYPWRLKVGDHVWLGEDAWVDNLENVTIASHACISQGAYLCTGNHDWRKASFDYRLAPIAIGVGAWVGAKSVVTPGVMLGDAAILTAGSVATRSLAPGAVYAGNPAVYVNDRWPSEKNDLKSEVQYT